MAGTCNFFGALYFVTSPKKATEFHGFNFWDCRAVGHAHQDTLALVHQLVLINFRWWKIPQLPSQN